MFLKLVPEGLVLVGVTVKQPHARASHVVYRVASIPAHAPRHPTRHHVSSRTSWSSWFENTPRTFGVSRSAIRAALRRRRLASPYMCTSPAAFSRAWLTRISASYLPMARAKPGTSDPNTRGRSSVPPEHCLPFCMGCSLGLPKTFVFALLNLLGGRNPLGVLLRNEDSIRSGSNAGDWAPVAYGPASANPSRDGGI